MRPKGAFFLISVALSSLAFSEVFLVKDGQGVCVIVVKSKGREKLLSLAKEFQGEIEKATGATLPMWNFLPRNPAL